MSLAAISLRKKTVSMVLTLALLVGGTISFLDMPRLEDPEFTIKQALVVTNYPGATAAEVADEVTDVIESAAQQMGQLDKVTSVNYRGRSVVTVEMKDAYDTEALPQVWDELRRKINDVQGQLPPGAGPSVVVDDFSDVYGILLAVTGDGYSQKDVQDYADFLRKELLLVDTVAKVTIWGKQQENVYVEMSRARLNQLGVSRDSVYETLSQRNQVVPAGNVRVDRDYVEIYPTGSISSVASLGDLYVKDASSQELTPLRDIATISRGYSDPPTQIMHYNGRSAVAVGISMTSSGNIVALGQALDAKLKALKAQTPAGIKINRVYYQPERVDGAVSSFVANLAEAVAIVIVVLLLFMGMQSGLLIGVILLVTICGSFIFISMAGVALERISLGALVIALGMLVDNAIVVVEGILIRYQQGADRYKAAVEVVDQSKWPLLGATIVAIMAFAGIGLSPDSVGEFCRSLFTVLLISLLMSWITAVTITPLLCERFLHPKVQEGNAPYDGRLYRIYKALLEFCLGRRGLTMVTMVALLVAAVMGFGYVKQSFFPSSTQPRFYIHYWLPQGTDIRSTNSDVRTIEQRILKDDRVKSVTSFVGEGAPRFILTYTPEQANGSYAMMLVEVKDYLQVDEVVAEYKTRLANEFPDAEPKVQKFRLGPGRDASIEVRFSGPDTRVLRDLSHQAQKIMMETGNAEAIRDNWRQMIKIVRPVMSEAQAKRAGITRPALAEAMRMAFSGVQVGVYREFDELLPIIVRAPASERKNVQEIGNVMIFSPVAQSMIPVEEVVSSFDTTMAFGMLKTRNRMLTITASCDPIHGLPSELLARVKPKLEALELPPGYFMEWGGEYEDAHDAQTALAKALVLPVIIMVLVTIMLFNNLRNPLIIWLTVPLALIGVTLGLVTTGEPFGFMALLGFLSLSGMLIKNAVVLLDQIKIEMEAGKPPYTAIVHASVSRIRPVAMAAATTILGMVPLVTDPFFSAMAVTIMSGLAFATLLTLIVVPVLYSLLYKIVRP